MRYVWKFDVGAGMTPVIREIPVRVDMGAAERTICALAADAFSRWCNGMKVGVLTNLNSRKNLSGGAVFESAGIGDDCLVCRTRDITEIRPALERFVDNGCEYWVADGGDGTLHWMLNEGREVLRCKGLWRDCGSYPRIIPSNGGTIDFVARTVGIKGRTDQVVQRLVDGLHADEKIDTVRLDTIEVRGHVPGDPDDHWSFERTGFAIALGGIGQKFFSKYYERPNRNPLDIIDISARASVGYLASLLPEKLLPDAASGIKDFGRFILSGTHADVVADGRAFDYGVYQGLHASSVEIDFGTMKLFEYARDPGKMHIVVGDLPLIECAWKWTWYVAGKPIPGKRWHEFAGASLDVRATGDQLLDPVIDGEMFFGFDRVGVRIGPAVDFALVPVRR